MCNKSWLAHRVSALYMYGYTIDHNSPSVWCHRHHRLRSSDSARRSIVVHRVDLRIFRARDYHHHIDAMALGRNHHNCLHHGLYPASIFQQDVRCIQGRHDRSHRRRICRHVYGTDRHHRWPLHRRCIGRDAQPEAHSG